MVVHGFPGEGGFLSVICKDFLHLCDCLVLHYFLEASSIYSSIIERKREKRLIIKVGSIKKVGSCVCFPVSFSTYKTCKHCAFQQRKKLCINILISPLKFMGEYFEISFSGQRVPLNSVMDIHYSTAEGGAHQNRMALHVRGEQQYKWGYQASFKHFIFFTIRFHKYKKAPKVLKSTKKH